jgi:hypothetical protein
MVVEVSLQGCDAQWLLWDASLADAQNISKDDVKLGTAKREKS